MLSPRGFYVRRNWTYWSSRELPLIQWGKRQIPLGSAYSHRFFFLSPSAAVDAWTSLPLMGCSQSSRRKYYTMLTKGFKVVFDHLLFVVHQGAWCARTLHVSVFQKQDPPVVSESVWQCQDLSHHMSCDVFIWLAIHKLLKEPQTHMFLSSQTLLLCAARLYSE